MAAWEIQSFKVWEVAWLPTRPQNPIIWKRQESYQKQIKEEIFFPNPLSSSDSELWNPSFTLTSWHNWDYWVTHPLMLLGSQALKHLKTLKKLKIQNSSPKQVADSCD